MRLTWLSLGLLAVLAACERELETSETEVAPSDGMQVVRSERPVWSNESPWTLSGTPSLDLARTGSGPAHEFFRVTDLLRLPDGRIVVGDFGALEVRCYSKKGQLLWSCGRRGDGPGEFRWITRLSRMRGDSIVAFDRSLNRATILSSTGELGRVVSFGSELQRVRRLQSYSDSLFLALTESFAGSMTPGNYRIPLAVVLLGPEGSVLDTLRMIGGSEGFLSASGVDGALPFGKNGHLAVEGHEFLVGTADSLAFDRYSAPWTLSQTVSVPGYELGLTSQQIDSTRQALLRRGDGRPHPSDVIEAIESIKIPDHRPGYSRLLLDEEGYAWAAQSHAYFTAERWVPWEVFAPTGQWLGRFNTPVGFQVFRIGADHILGVQLDELDVEHVQLLPISRGD